MGQRLQGVAPTIERHRKAGHTSPAGAAMARTMVHFPRTDPNHANISEAHHSCGSKAGTKEKRRAGLKAIPALLSLARVEGEDT